MESGAIFTPKTKKTLIKKKCSVPGCSSCPTKDRNVVFHNFPTKNASRILVQTAQGRVFKDRLSLWLESCHITSKEHLQSYAAICSRHFTLDDYSKAGKLYLHYLRVICTGWKRVILSYHILISNTCM
jgi:hypothetical protein